MGGRSWRVCEDGFVVGIGFNARWLVSLLSSQASLRYSMLRWWRKNREAAHRAEFIGSKRRLHQRALSI